MGVFLEVTKAESWQAGGMRDTEEASLDRRVPASQRSPLPSSPAKAAGTLAGKVAEFPSLEVATRQLWGSGQAGGRGASGGAAEDARRGKSGG